MPSETWLSTNRNSNRGRTPGAAVAEYLVALAKTRGTGSAVAETSYYGALQQFLNSVGRELDPRVYANPHPKNRGSGIPDLGLFSEDQIGSAAGATPWDKQVPSRGVVEVKAPSESLDTLAASPQVSKYLAGYGQVLITNLRGFMLVSLNDNGSIETSVPIYLANSEEELWSLCDRPKNLTEKQVGDLWSFMWDALTRRAPITKPEHLAWFLASYARQARDLVEREGLGELAALRGELQTALGISYTGERAEKFFRSTVIQTLFYGIFSVWVLWWKSEEVKEDEKFDWRLAGWKLDVPVISLLFDRIAQPGGIKRLGLGRLLDQAGDSLNRVQTEKFFRDFELNHAIEYFYEPFLAAFDPELRKELGVWYTPREVVQYMIARVDESLRKEFGLQDGLADESVIVLDPCVGTGSFLIEALRRIRETLLRKNPSDPLVGDDLREAVTRRLIGFEILPAPFVVAHLQLGLILRDWQAPLRIVDGSHSERAAVYLTNALTGWADEHDEEEDQLFPDFAREREAADDVKRRQAILVVIGNPPYNAFAGVSADEEGDLLDPYLMSVKTRHTLHDLYVRFFRVAERRIVETTGKGIVSFISNSSYLQQPSFRDMRRHLLAGFDEIHIDNLNGDRDETGKRTPLGASDPSVFSTSRNRAGIAEGVAIATMVRRGDQGRDGAVVTYRDFWGPTKGPDLALTLKGDAPVNPETDVVPRRVTPSSDNMWAFKPMSAGAGYYGWPLLPELAAEDPVYGLHEARGGVLMAVDREVLAVRMREYLDPGLSLDDVTHRIPKLAQAWYGFDPKATRDRLLGRDPKHESRPFSEQKVQPFVFKPFDIRFAYLEKGANLWVAPQPELVKHARHGASFLYLRRTAEAADDGAPIFMSPHVGDQHALHKTAYLIPTFLGPDDEKAQQELVFDAEFSGREARANLSSVARRYLNELGASDPDASPEAARLVWDHALAICYAPQYTVDNRGPVRQNYPRVPLPDRLDLLKESAECGRQLARLLVADEAVLSRQGAVDPRIAALRNLDGGPIANAEDALRITENWGYVNARGATMAGAGRLVKRPRTEEEWVSMRHAIESRGLDPLQMAELLGSEVVDIYLNSEVYWSNVPIPVWNFHVGGFQVLKKWLSYRQVEVSGCSLTKRESRYFGRMALALLEILMFGPSLDLNYSACAASHWRWPAGS